MIIFPAIDLIAGKAVRLLRGDYSRMTVYDNDPLTAALRFQDAGATHLHVVDLEGARDGGTPNIDSIRHIVNSTALFVEVGGGIRDMEVVNRYLDLGVKRVILGTAAIEDEVFTNSAINQYPDAVALGADIKGDKVAIRGWATLSEMTLSHFCQKYEAQGLKTLICTDISRDGAMMGTNLELYAALQKQYDMNIIASGGISTLDDVKALAKAGVYGAIIGKACYTGAIDLEAAIEVSGA
ncbi:MAG: 1-(5-phosphoribosyl)-5-[Clostridia bacterium]|nr:1-(5-phosphoribosyl)-5-[(5-phosphoribosylamino)methylideneamino]imidazole-4-carboxamide isomerase [Clostridia bacterium]